MCDRVLRRYVMCEGEASNHLKRLDISCDEVRMKKDELLKEFREKNGSDRIIASGRQDRAYDEFKESIERFLEMCKTKISDVCEKCKPEEHEGYMCRCEDRNIKLAKQKRDEGKSPWVKK